MKCWLVFLIFFFRDFFFSILFILWITHTLKYYLYILTKIALFTELILFFCFYYITVFCFVFLTLLKMNKTILGVLWELQKIQKLKKGVLHSCKQVFSLQIISYMYVDDMLHIKKYITLTNKSLKRLLHSLETHAR